MGDSAGRVNQQPLEPRKPLRLWPGVVAVALQWLVMFGLSCLLSRARRHCDPRGSRRRIGRAPVVDLLQPCAVVGAYRCGCHHGGRRRRHVSSRSRVHCERDDGIHVVRLRRATPDPRARRVGGGERTPFRTRATRFNGRRAPPRMRSADARPHRRHYGRRHCRFRMAMDADSGTTAARAHR